MLDTEAMKSIKLELEKIKENLEKLIQEDRSDNELVLVPIRHKIKVVKFLIQELKHQIFIKENLELNVKSDIGV